MVGLQSKHITAERVEIQMNSPGSYSIWLDKPGGLEWVAGTNDYEVARILADALSIRMHLPQRDRVKEWLDEQQRE